MELKLIGRVFVRRWYLIVLPVLVASVFVLPSLLNRGTSAGGFSASFRYSAAQATSNLPQREGDFQDVWLASEFTVNAFTEWVRSSSFRHELAQALQTAGAELDLAPLGIASDRARSIGLVQMSYPTAEGLEQLVELAMQVLSERNAAYFPHLGGQNASVSILDMPQVTPAPPPITNRFAPLIQLAVALVAGVALAFLVEYLDPSLRVRQDLEQQGWRVLANIPQEKGT